MINGNNNKNIKIVESICTLNGFRYKVQIEYEWKRINNKSVCCKVFGSMKILEQIH